MDNTLQVISRSFWSSFLVTTIHGADTGETEFTELETALT